jgi:hypothetical protein
MPTDFWPRDYDSVLQNELMKAVLGETMKHEADPLPSQKA